MSTRGERIQQALSARRINKQQALAAELKVHESAITRWKENKAMSLESAVAFCAALDVSLDWLLLGRGTIDSHRRPCVRDSGAVPSDDGGDRYVCQRLGPRSTSLLLSMIESIALDQTIERGSRHFAPGATESRNT